MRVSRILVAVAATALMVFGLALAPTMAQASAGASAGHNYKHACGLPAPGHATCLVLYRTDKPSGPKGPSGFGYGPSDLQSAYNLPSSTTGSGQTVALVDAYDDPNIVSDVATYRSAWGLPACGAGCFSVVNQNGAASPLPPTEPSGQDWDLEESLDVDMVSAICPLCHIILVETDSNSFTDLGTGVDAAVSLGAGYVSNSYGAGDFSGEASLDTYYNHPGVAVTASAGDDGYGVEYPAASQYVTAVGGTTLNTETGGRGWTETVWPGTGSGCSAYEPKPSWQTDTGCSDRTNNDVSAVADPNTGVAVYDTYTFSGWVEVGGTSASSPLIASVFALAGTPASGTYPSSYIYQHTSDLYDVTSGSNGTCSPAYLCTAEPGYDGPTGWGTPDGTAAFKSGSSSGYTLTVTNSATSAGTVTSSPSGINCGSTCSASFPSGTVVTLTATPVSGAVFTGWTGACAGMASNTCTVTMSANEAVSASFTASAKVYQYTAATYKGTWTVSKCLCYVGGADKYSKASGASASFTFTGNEIQFVSKEKTTQGSFKIYVDGVLKGTISTYSTTTQNAVIVWSASFASVGKHTIKIVNAGTSGHPRVDVNAFVVST
jgi:subtilase family serine protease